MAEKKLIESSDDVVRVLSLFEASRLADDHHRDISNILVIIERVRTSFLSRIDPAWVNWVDVFGRMGADAMHEMDRKGICLVEHYQHAAMDEFGAFLVKKNNAYGDTPIRRWGELGTIIRIDSKVQRYIHMTQNPDVDNLGENRADTIRDIVGYCVLGYQLVMDKQEVRHTPVQ